MAMHESTKTAPVQEKAEVFNVFNQEIADFLYAFPGSVYWYGSDGTLHGASESALEDIRDVTSTPDFSIGMNIYELYQGPNLDELKAQDQTLLSSVHNTLDTKQIISFPSGKVKHYHTKKRVARAKNGSLFIIGTSLVIHDSSQSTPKQHKKKKSDAFNNFQHDIADLLHAFPGNLYCYALDGTLYGASEAAVKTIREATQTPNFDVGMNFYGLFSGKNLDEIKGQDALLLHARKKANTKANITIKESTLDSEQMITFPNGKVTHFLTSKRVVSDKDGKQFIIGTSLDSTKLKTMEKALTDNIKELDRIQKVKNNFLLNINHDLRTPCNGILGTIEQCLENSDDPELNSKLNDIYACTQNLLEIINQIINLTHIDSHDLKLELLSLGNIVDSNMALLTPLVKQKNITIIKNIHEESIVSDAVLFNRLYLNLLSNAVKYLHQNGEITISFESYFVDQKKWLRFNVKDNGKGIPKELEETVFELFNNANSRQNNHAKLGMGLYSCKQIVNDLCGSIFIKDNVDHNFSIEIHLPYLLSQQENKQDESKLAQYHDINLDALCIKTVLIVEDDEISSKVLRNYMSKYNVEVTCVATLSEVKALNDQQFDLILSDLNLTDGLATDIFNYSVQYQRIICITADNTLEIHQKAMNAGFHKVLIKPINREIIDQIMR